MTQTPRKAVRPAPFKPKPGDQIKRRTSDDIGTVIESDEWWDTLLLRGVDISDQVLVDWTVAPGPPIVKWEQTSQLEAAPAPAAEKKPEVAGDPS